MSKPVATTASSYRFSEALFSGYIGGLVIAPGPPAFDVVSAVKLLFYDNAGIKKGEISSDIGKGVLGRVTFELLDTGCGAFSFELLRDWAALDISYTHRVDIHLFNDPTAWFSGQVLRLPKDGSTEETLKYSGHGYYWQMGVCKVDQKYTSTEVSAIVDAIVQNFVQPNTDIVYNASKIIATSPTVTVNEIDFDRCKAKKAVQDLSDIAQNYEWGVDEDRELYFRPIDTEVKTDAVKFVGHHLEKFIPKEDTSKILNEIDILAGKITSGSNYIVTVSDATSQSTYGKRWGKKTIPSALNSTDAQRWGEWQIELLKDAKQSAKVKGIELLGQKIECKGKARITDDDGTKHELAIKRVTYKVDPNGIMADMELGELEVPVADDILQLLRDIQIQELLQAANVDQLSS